MKNKVITLCGSTRFKEEFLKVQKALTLQGNIVLTPGVFSQAEGQTLSNQQLRMLKTLHRKKIDMSDEVLVIKVCGYMGKSTMSEAVYAMKNGKRVTYLEVPYENR